MYYKIEDNKFTGFYEQKDKDGTFTEISIEDWQALLNKQSEGEVIFYNSKSKKLETIKLGKFETFDGTKVATDTQALKNSILNELSILKNEFATKEFVFKGIYLQKNRDVDKANLTSIVVMLNAMKQTKFKNWKFKDLEGKDVYADITIADMLTMAGIMQSQTTNTLIAESKLIKKLETLSVEELLAFDSEAEFKTLLGLWLWKYIFIRQEKEK